VASQKGILALTFSLLPSLLLPILLLLPRPSWKRSLPLLVPPSPFVLHLLFLRQQVTEGHCNRLNSATRACSLAASLLSSFSLLLLSSTSLVSAAVKEDKVDLSSLEREMSNNGCLVLAMIASAINLIVALIRYNESRSGTAITLLVGFPFLLGNLFINTFSFSLLLAFSSFSSFLLHILLSLAVSVVAILVGVGGRLGGGKGALAALLLAAANMLMPVGYARRPAGPPGKNWCHLVISWLGGSALHASVIYQAILYKVPRTLSVLVPVGWLSFHAPQIEAESDYSQITMPEHNLEFDGNEAVLVEFDIGEDLAAKFSQILPSALILAGLPFMVLRALLLEWDCALVPHQDYEADGPLPNKARGCATLCCAIIGVIFFTQVSIMILPAVGFLIWQSLTSPRY